MKNINRNRACRIVAISLVCCLTTSSWADEVKTENLSARNESQVVLQKQTVKGCVRDQNGEPLVGVTVKIQGTSLGTITDIDGNYSLPVPNDQVKIEFSYVGYNTVLMTPGIRKKLDVILKEDVKALDEVVVVGYGTMKKRDLVGAVDHINSDALEGRAAPSLTRSLQGQIPNLNISMRDGKPDRGATYNVRGTTSIGAGGSALVLIDGVEGDPNSVNPQDIESVSVLKDASSAAVYGARGTFGVVLITTKNAKKGGVKVDYSGSVSFSQRTVKPKLITNGLQWTDDFVESFVNNKGTMPTSINNIFPYSPEWHEELRRHNANPDLPEVQINENTGKYEYYGNTDWDKLLYKDVVSGTDHSMSITGGNDIASFYVSGRYFLQDGIYRQNSDDYNRANFRAKGTIQIKPWLSIDNNFDMMHKTYHYPLISYDQTLTVQRNMEQQGYPMAVLYNPDGSLTYSSVYSGVGDFYSNSSYQDQTTLQYKNTFGVNLTPIKDILKFRGDFTYVNTAYKRNRVMNYVPYSTGPDEFAEKGKSIMMDNKDETRYMAANINGTWTPKLGDDHSFSMMGGWNLETSNKDTFYSERDGFLFSDKPNYDLMDGINYKLEQGDKNWAYVGFFYRLNYGYKGRYLVETSGRYDGSSKFPSNQMWGFFPSGSLAWRISEENFMQSTRSWLDNFKLRFSVGTLGNGNVDPYMYLPTMGISKSSVIIGDGQVNYTSYPGLIPSSLTWEKVTTYDVGLDMDLFKNRLTLGFDWYRRNTTDMYTVGPTLPDVLGTTQPKGNYADLKTKGWELTISWRDNFKLAGSDFHYGVKFMLWDSQSWITKYNNTTGKLSDYYEGYRIGDIWGYNIDGLFSSYDEIANHADQDYIKISDTRIWQPGDLKFVDLNGDGKIDKGAETLADHGDLTIVGNEEERYHYGINLNASWRGIGISAFFQGVGKRDWYPGQESGYFYGKYNRPYGYSLKMHENRWTQENPNPNAYWPRMVAYSSENGGRPMGTPNNRYMQDASYLRLKALTIDYSLPQAWVSKLGLSGLKIYFTGENLFTFSNICENFDPEVIKGGDVDLKDRKGEEQGYSYPMLKTYTVGLNVSF
ncbi:SusC/RagA family TonB-linked outer membrane protein [Bacteroides faecalis]|uniref:SusC/RagA family TonB-linked outer membrane protein n=1 Tax=Bacteroides faecalis TaxID=2447885 RepID=A0A401LVC1_9BACE|nr:TonB-dependent receptor [Bacteroides faecalis]GCB35465.1 SusC/RagA family TonB-linked outer membrane protein [Bacteroides faecalis]